MKLAVDDLVPVGQCLVHPFRKRLPSFRRYPAQYRVRIPATLKKGRVAHSRAIRRHINPSSYSRVPKHIDMNVFEFFEFIGCNEISHENISGKRVASEGAGLNVSGPAKRGKGRERGGEGGGYRRRRTLITASEDPRMTACDMRRMGLSVLFSVVRQAKDHGLRTVQRCCVPGLPPYTLSP